MADKKSYKLAFTMAEMLVCLSVISILATILIPTIGSLRPDRSKVMFKKAFMISERVVSELVNDSDLYPEASGVNGLDNVGVVYYNGEPFGGKYVAKPAGFDEYSDGDDKPEGYDDYVGSLADQKSKFCKLFAQKVNITSQLNCAGGAGFSADADDEGKKGNPTFRTSDGIEWLLPITNFTAGNTNDLAWKAIMVDVNGPKGPNKLDEEGDANICNGDVDRFTIYVRTDGLMAVNGACAREYMNNNYVVKNEKAYSGKKVEEMRGPGNKLVNVVEDGVSHVANKDSDADVQAITNNDETTTTPEGD